MEKEKILVVDDEEDILELVRYNLSREGYKVTGSLTGEDALRKVRSDTFDLIVLDLMLPGMDGLAFTKTVKNDSRLRRIPIIMLTAKGEESDIVTGLELGADDYITKPFSMRELVARVKTILKRYGKKPEEAPKAVLKFPQLEIDIEKHEVKASGKPVELTAKEFELLRYLAENKGKAISRERLLDTVWGIEVAIETRTVDVHVKRLREKLGKRAGEYILTLRGVGYKFRE